MSEILMKLEQYINTEQFQKLISQLDDRHNPVFGSSVWNFTYRTQPYEFIRHGGYLRASVTSA